MPLPAIVLICASLEASTKRIRAFEVSAMYRLPAASQATSYGPDRYAFFAGPPSPRKSAWNSEPATTLRPPLDRSVVTTRLAPRSAMYGRPSNVRHMPCGPVRPSRGEGDLTIRPDGEHGSRAAVDDAHDAIASDAKYLSDAGCDASVALTTVSRVGGAAAGHDFDQICARRGMVGLSTGDWRSGVITGGRDWRRRRRRSWLPMLG